MVSKTETLNAQGHRALMVLAEGQRSKSRLAVETYGEDNASTRSMISRLSKQLVESGLAVERKDGRERVMGITERGQSLLVRGEAASSKHEPVPHVPTLHEALTSLDDTKIPGTHANDRPRFHLRHAALLALSNAHRTGVRSVADEHYEAMLRTLVHDDGHTEAKDKKVFESLKLSWPNDLRKRLMECLVNFQSLDSRRKTGPDFVAHSDQIKPGPEAVLWASGAIDLAHHYSFAPGSQIDRMTARRLLRKAKELLEETANVEPNLGIAVKYRLGKIGKVALAGWNWKPAENAKVNTLPQSWPELANEEAEILGASMKRMDSAVIRAADFNHSLQEFEQALRSYVSRWVMLAYPSSEWVFRRAGGLDIATAINEWALQMRKEGSLTELLVERTQEEASAPFRKTLTEFLEKSFKSLQLGPDMRLQPYIAQAQGLLGKGNLVGTESEASAPDSKYYDRMLMNNLWNPEMVTAHAAATAGEIG